MEFIKILDKYIFIFINKNFSNHLFDNFFVIWTDITKTLFFKLIIAPLILFAIYKKKSWPGLAILIWGILGLLFLEESVRFFKEYFERVRPYIAIKDFPVLTPGKHEKNFSFPSGHATDAGYLCCYLYQIFKKYIWLFILMTSSIMFSRVYIGVHYPLDVYVGAIYGSLWAFAIFKLFLRIPKLKEFYENQES